MTSLTPTDAQRSVREWLEDIAGYRKPAESTKAMLRRIATASGLTTWRVKKLWYGETGNIPWHEAETIRLRAQQMKETRARWADMQFTRRVSAAVAEQERLDRDGFAALGNDRRQNPSTLLALAMAEAEREGQARFDLGDEVRRTDSDGE